MLSTRSRITRELRCTIGQRLKERRIALRLTQEDLAWVAEVTQGTISNYETGRNEVPLSVLLVLAQHLGVSPEYFVPSLTGAPVAPGAVGPDEAVAARSDHSRMGDPPVAERPDRGATALALLSRRAHAPAQAPVG
jgi:transcriptional regulator with XRE-family HTH domain